MSDTVKVDKKALREVAKSVKSFSKAAATAVSLLAGEDVEKSAEELVENLSDQGLLPELDRQQKKAMVQKLKFDPTNAHELTQKYAEWAKQTRDETLGEVGTPSKPTKSASYDLGSDEAWAQVDTLNV